MPHEEAAVEHVKHQAHELPNLITLLHENFEHAPVVQFLHQWENILFSLVAISLLGMLALGGAKANRLIPEGVQNLFEAIVEGITGFVTGILGEQGEKHVPFLGTLFLYILFMNWIGLVPLMKSPTSAWSTTIAVGLITMFYVQITGIREQGFFNYLKHVAGNPSNGFGIVLIPLMLVLNIILEFGAVPFSLSLRLFANVSSEDRLLFNFASLDVARPFLPLFFQLFANVLAIIFSMVQAFVFMLLSTVYLSLVMPHGDHKHEDHGEAAGHPAH
ncbi:MAG: ATP synthase F0 subunit A [Candidatus Omnitrophica bacterium]|nr:ATP synthase F0 subunit A [Candidatus Omnitrophota bacterium]